MANLILGYIVIGLILSGLYVWRVEDTKTMHRLPKKKYTAALVFVVALITLFWFPIGMFAVISVIKSRLWE